MTKYIYIITLFIIQISLGQNMNPERNISIQAEEIIKAYIKKIGGEKKINKIKTLQKKIEIKITNSSHVKMNALIMYKQPNLYNLKYNKYIPTSGERAVIAEVSPEKLNL